MARHITPAILQMVARLSREGRTQLDIVAITVVSQSAISKILKRSRKSGTLNQRPRGFRKDRQIPEKSGFCWEWCATSIPFKFRLRVEFNRRIGRRISVGNINQRLLTAGHPSRRPTTCLRLKREHHGDTVIETFVTGGTVSSLTSPALNYITVMVGFEFAGVKVKDKLMHVCNKIMTMWYRAPFTSGARASLSLLRAPWTSKFTNGCLGRISFPGQGAPFAITLCWFKMMLL